MGLETSGPAVYLAAVCPAVGPGGRRWRRADAYEYGFPRAYESTCVYEFTYTHGYAATLTGVGVGVGAVAALAPGPAALPGRGAPHPAPSRTAAARGVGDG